MNLKGFKKVHEDDDKAILKNKKGHSITLAKKGLSKTYLENLSNLPLHAAEGADVLSPEEQNDVQQSQQAEAAQLPTLSAPTAQQQIQPQQVQPQPQAMPAQQVEQQPVADPTLGAPMTPEQKFQQAKAETFAKHAEEYGRQAALWDQDLANGHITPKTYKDLFAEKSTLGKIGTIFGMLVSGAGSGLAHQTNAALDMMNKEIERDLEAQKTSKSNAMNYYRANLEHMRTQSENALRGAQTKQTEASTQLDIDTHAKNQMGLAILRNLQDMNNKLPPQQRAQGQQIIDGVVKPALTKKIQQDNQRAAALKTETEFQQQNQQMRLAESLGVLPGGSGLAAAAEERHIPGIPGEASRAVPPGDRLYLESAQNFEKQLNAFASWAKAHSGDLSPTDIKTGQTLAAELQGAYRQATNGGVYKEGEQNFISKIIDSNPTKFFNEIRVLPQLDVLSKDNKRRMDSKLKGLGFAGYPGHKETKWVNGIEYEKGPNGEAIPVKR